MKELTENQMAALDKIAASHPEPATHGHLVAGFLHADQTIEDLRKEITELKTQVGALLARVTGVEKRPALRYAGKWSESEDYSEGALVSRSGGLWLAQEPSRGAIPGRSSAFKLIVKSKEAA